MEMDAKNHSKASKMRGMMYVVADDFAREGRVIDHNTMRQAAGDLSLESLCRLYDIIKSA